MNIAGPGDFTLPIFSAHNPKSDDLCDTVSQMPMI